MTPFATRKRPFLIVIAFGLAAANLVWIFNKSQPEIRDFEIELTSHALAFDKGYVEDFPLFDHDAMGWSLHGQPLPTVHPYLIDSDPEQIGPDGIGKYLAFRLPEDANMKASRSAFLNLASQGICQVAIVDTSHRQGQFYETVVYRIRKVRTNEDRIVDCKHRV